MPLQSNTQISDWVQSYYCQDSKYPLQQEGLKESERTTECLILSDLDTFKQTNICIVMNYKVIVMGLVEQG